jgi:hypothetical protein
MANEKSGKAWIPADQKQLKELARGNTPTGIIAMKLGRRSGNPIESSQPGRLVKPTESVAIQPPEEVMTSASRRTTPGSYLRGGRCAQAA